MAGNAGAPVRRQPDPDYFQRWEKNRPQLRQASEYRQKESGHGPGVGVGSLGKALLGYKGFKDYGLEIVGAFDKYDGIVGNEIKGVLVSSLDRLETFIKENDIHIGIITVPVEFAQEICDRLVKSEVQAIWNFAPTILNVPEGIFIQTENMASSLAVLTRHLESKN